jgi:hypothetical protein
MAKRTQKIENPFVDVQAGSKAVREDILLTQAVIELLNKDLANTRANATALKTALGDKSGGNLANMQAVNTAMAQGIDLQKKEEALIKARTSQQEKLEKALERQRIADIKLQQQREKSIDDYNKKLARQEAQQEKLAKKTEQQGQAYNRVNGWLNKLSQEHRNLAIKQELGIKLTAEEIKRMETLTGRIQRYDTALKNVDATQGKYQRNVGNYKSAFNGLDNSVQQLTRELPAFANSMQTGFMAISNNLPIFFDEITKIKQANKLLAESGQPTVSAFKQIGASIFSMTGILGLAVTALTVLGPKLIEFFTGSEKNEKQLEQERKQQELLNKERHKSAEFVGRESAEYVGYLLQLKKTNAGSKERSELITEINDKYGTTLQNIKDEAKFQRMLNAEIANYITYQRTRYEVEKNQDLIRRNLENQDRLRIDTAKELGISVKKLDEISSSYYQTLQAQQQGLIAEGSTDRIKQYSDQVTVLNKRLENYGFNLLEANMLLDDYDYSTEKSTKATKDFTTALNEFDNELERRVSLGENERKILQEIEMLKRNAQIGVVADLVNQELENQIQFAEQGGQIFVDTLEKLIAEEFELRRQATIDQAEFDLAELTKKFESERALAIQSLEQERDELLKQESLTANGKRAINTSYQQRIDELNEAYLEKERIVALEREKIELELQQALGALDQERIDRLNQVNDELIQKQQEFADKANKQAQENRKKELAEEKKYYDEIAKLGKKTADELLEYQIKKSQERQKILDGNISASEKESDILAQKASQGNLLAEESLKKQQEITNKYRDQRRQEEEKEQALQQAKKYVEIALNITNSLIQKGGEPITSAGKSIGIVSVIKGLFGKGFFFGTDDTGSNSPVSDGYGKITGFTHEKEQVWSQKDRADVGFASRAELKKSWDFMNSANMIIPKISTQTDVTHAPILKDQLRELSQIHKELKSQPKEFMAKEVVDDFLRIVHTRVEGNTTYKKYSDS